MAVQDRYKWEAELADGSTITEGADLSNAVRFSLIPKALGLPQHDIIGLKMISRFGRGFIYTDGRAPEYLHCVVCESHRLYVRYSDGACIETPADYELNQ